MLAPSGYSDRYSDRYDRMDRYGNGFRNDRDGYGRNYNYGGRKGYSMDRYDYRNGMGRGYGYRGMGRMGGGRYGMSRYGYNDRYEDQYDDRYGRYNSGRCALARHLEQPKPATHRPMMVLAS